jgi:hypothetical protein
LPVNLLNEILSETLYCPPISKPAEMRFWQPVSSSVQSGHPLAWSIESEESQKRGSLCGGVLSVGENIALSWYIVLTCSILMIVYYYMDNANRFLAPSESYFA